MESVSHSGHTIVTLFHPSVSQCEDTAKILLYIVNIVYL